MSAVIISGDSSGSISLQAPAVAGTTTLTLPTTSGTVLNDATVGVCRAWVNFNGTGTVAIRASFNVSSITDNGTGLYTVNFTNSMPDINYSTVITTTSTSDATGRDICTTIRPAIYSTSQVGVFTFSVSAGAVDKEIVAVSVFR